MVKRMLGSFDGGVHIGFAGFLEDTYEIAPIGWIHVLKSLSSRGFDPLAIDEILENSGLCAAGKCS